MTTRREMRTVHYILGIYERGNDIVEGDITEVRVY